ncbi:MAG: glycosyltransferase family 39 protein [Deltaproteobacteria bacterium]|nr:glycosyltransferase family 39 protein [Deltaproteobacteria bacterium]
MALGRGPVLVRALLLAASFCVPAFLMAGKSATFDEVAHLPAGFSYLRTRAITLNLEHPPLIKELCALPLLLLGARMPAGAPTIARSSASPTYQWEFGRQFLYRQDADRLLFWGRMPAVALSLGLAAVVTIWARRLWGENAALLALALYVLDPTITAHAQLVTTDVGLAFFATLFLLLLRGYLETPRLARLLLCGVTLGLGLGAKFSGVILVPIAMVLALIASMRGEPGLGARSRRTIACLAAVGLMTAIACAVLWAMYFFPSDPFFYLEGLKVVNRDRDPNYRFYLMGDLRPGGWDLYLLVAWLVKTPLASLLLLGASVLVFLRGRRAALLDEAFLVVPAVAFFAGYSMTSDNLGVRYLVPCFPFFFIFASRIAGCVAWSGGWPRDGLALCLLWMLIEFVAIWPDHLCYFNQIAGVPPRGSEWLDDSNVDWGQGLLQLRDYLAEHPSRDLRLCYFGAADPGYYGIRAENVTISELTRPPQRGTYIVSANCVARATALARLRGAGAESWLATATARAVVGHALYVYDLR